MISSRMAFRSLFSLTLVVCGVLFSTITLTPAQAQGSVKAPACENTLWVCPSVTDLGPNNVGYHTLKLNATNLPATDPANGTPIQWSIVCGYDDAVKGQLFSSGNKETDRQLCLGEDTLDYMSRPVTYGGRQYANWGMDFLNGTTSPMTTADGSFEAYVRPHSFDVHNHTCFLVAQTSPDVVGRGDTNVSTGSRDTDSLVYATFRTQGEPAECLSVRGDPMGRVFNEKLKPVPGSVVNIFDFNTKAAMSVPGVPNPITTHEDGMFNFNIEPGTTYLTTNLTNMDITKVHPNAALAYSNLYTYGNAIIETLNKPEQRDIPVSGGLQPILKLMTFSHLQLGDKTRLEGRASWPLTLVEVMQGEKIVAQQNADAFGGFSFFIDNANIDASQQLTLRLTEVDMLAATPVPAQNPKTVERIFDPIPRYLEGYAYDKNGKTMPFATVRVVLDLSDVVYYETKADAEAFFSVGPRFLPILPFHLEYSPSNVIPAPANTIKVTVPTFAKKNKPYFDNNLIDLMRGTKNGKAVDPAAFVKNTDQKKTGGTGNGANGDGQNGAGGNSQAGNGQGSGQYNKTGGGLFNSPLGSLAGATGQSSTVLLTILILLFVIVAAALVMYVRNQRAGTMSHTRGSDYDEEEEPEEVV